MTRVAKAGLLRVREESGMASIASFGEGD
jgi:hypothetical protein